MSSNKNYEEILKEIKKLAGDYIAEASTNKKYKDDNLQDSIKLEIETLINELYLHISNLFNLNLQSALAILSTFFLKTFLEIAISGGVSASHLKGMFKIGTFSTLESTWDDMVSKIKGDNEEKEEESTMKLPDGVSRLLDLIKNRFPHAKVIVGEVNLNNKEKE